MGKKSRLENSFALSQKIQSGRRSRSCTRAGETPTRVLVNTCKNILVLLLTLVKIDKIKQLNTLVKIDMGTENKIQVLFLQT